MRCWMTGRYGPDVYGMFLLIAAMVLNCSNMFFRNIFLYAAADALFLYEMYRMFSKNIVKRASENSNYLLFATKFRHWFMARKQGNLLFLRQKAVVTFTNFYKAIWNFKILF